MSRRDEPLERYIAMQRDELERVLAVCESPIECTLLTALLVVKDARGAVFDLCPRSRGGVDPVATGRHQEMKLHAQFPLDGMRLDFAIICGENRIAVEADGHDFHERTREQAQKDKARDRALVAAGWKPLRFTGSEIHANPERCAAEVLRLLRIDVADLPAVVAAQEVVPRDRVRSGFTASLIPLAIVGAFLDFPELLSDPDVDVALAGLDFAASAEEVEAFVAKRAAHPMFEIAGDAKIELVENARKARRLQSLRTPIWSGLN